MYIPMKSKSVFLAAAALMVIATTAHAGPQVVISFNSGGYCAPRPVYYYQPAVVCRPVTVYRPVYTQRSAWGSDFHSGYGNAYSRGGYAYPAYRVQKARQTPCRTSSFAWRR